jgi:hypothetical protein
VPSDRRGGFVVLTLVAVSLAISAAYVVGYRRPDYHPPSPGRAATLQVAAQVWGMSLGPAGCIGWAFAPHWSVASTGVLLLTAASIALAFWTALCRPTERARIAGLLVLYVGVGTMSLAIGWGRAVFGETIGFENRYITLAAPALFAAYFLWGLGAPAALGRLMQLALFALMCGLVAYNAHEGRNHARRDRAAFNRVVAEIQADVPPEELAHRFREVLYAHPLGTYERLTGWLSMLRATRMGPYHGS